MNLPHQRKRASTGKFFFLLHALFFFTSPCFSQEGFSSFDQDAFRAIFRLRFEEARSLASTEQKRDPRNPVPLYLEGYADFLKVFIGEEKQDYSLFLTGQDRRMEKMDGCTRSTPWYSWCRGNMSLQTGLIKLKFGDYRSAAFDINRAYRELNANRSAYPGFLPNNTGLGLIHILVGLVPDSFDWLLDLFGVEGDVVKGSDELKQMVRYAGKDPVTEMLRIEALLNLALIDANLGKNAGSSLAMLQDFEKSRPAFPDTLNPVMIFVRAGIFMKNGRNDRAILALQQYRTAPGAYPFHYLDYLLGLAKLNRLDPDADRFLLRFLSNFNGQNYIRSAYQKMAWTGLLSGNRKRYDEYMARIPLRGNDFVDADRQAGKEAEKKEVPNLLLLKARLLYDGGYYDRALALLRDLTAQATLTTRKDRLESTYRLGRICQSKGDEEEALRYFETTIREGADATWYFAANAALQSGLIYEARGDRANAERAYRRCLSMDYDEYKNSLSQKAKAGLKRVKQ